MKIALRMIFAGMLILSCKGNALTQSTAMFHNGAQHLGVFVSDTAGELVRLKWKYKTQGRIFSSPVVYEDICLIGSEDTYFYAFDAQTGREIWRFETGGAVNSTAAADGGTVFFVSMDGCLYALDVETGRLRWKFMAEGEKTFDIWDPYLSSPCVDRGAVYFGSGDGSLYAVDAESGKLIWRFATKGIIHSSPAVGQNLVYFGNCEGKVYAVEKKTGGLKWQYKTYGWPDIPKGEILGSPSLADGILYIGAKDHGIYALDAITGAEKWYYAKYPGWVVSTPAVSDGTVYYGRTGDYLVYAREAATGALKWTFDTGYFIYSSPAIAGQTLYIGCFNGKLYAIDIRTGMEKWVFQTDGGKANYTVFFDEYDQFRTELYGSYMGPNLFDYLVTMGSILSSPWVEEGNVYFGSADGYLYALEIR